MCNSPMEITNTFWHNSLKKIIPSPILGEKSVWQNCGPLTRCGADKERKELLSIVDTRFYSFYWKRKKSDQNLSVLSFQRQIKGGCGRGKYSAQREVRDDPTKIGRYSKSEALTLNTCLFCDRT